MRLHYRTDMIMKGKGGDGRERKGKEGKDRIRRERKGKKGR